jgi:hypothetical protein
MSIFGNFTKGLTNFLDFGNTDDDLNSLSQEELLRKVSSINQENLSLQKSINEISKENYLLNNSIVNDNNKKNSEFSKFLNLMQVNLIHNKNSSDIKYSNKDFKKFLYKEKMFYGCLDENDIDILLKAKKDNKIEWDEKAIKEKNKLKQEILEKNLKNLYSNIFAIKVSNKKNKKNKKEIKDNNGINNNNNIIKKENEGDEKKRVKGKKLFEENKFLDLNMNKGLYENEVNMLEELIYNDDKNKDDDEN